MGLEEKVVQRLIAVFYKALPKWQQIIKNPSSVMNKNKRMEN